MKGSPLPLSFFVEVCCTNLYENVLRILGSKWQEMRTVCRIKISEIQKYRRNVNEFTES